MSLRHRITASIFGKASASRPPSTTPSADHKLRAPIWWTLAQISTLIATPLVLLHLYGQPALRMQATYLAGHDEYRNYTECHYLTLLDGWRTVIPAPGFNQCPTVTLLPFDLTQLFNGVFS